MNIVINYNFVNAVKDINEGFIPSKVVRNNLNMWIKFNLPFLTSLEIAVTKDKFFKYYPVAIAFHLLFVFEAELIKYKLLGDLYKDIADLRLKTLVSMLNDININTDYSLIKDSKCYHTVRNLKLNEKKIPQIVESKYILLHAYDNKGDIVETSLLQEHVMGSKQYVLSMGSPQKALKLAYSKI